MKIKSIRYVGKDDVYNMEVEDTHDFAVENGVIVHNCYDEARYLFMAKPIKPRRNMIKPKSILLADDPLNMIERPKVLTPYEGVGRIIY